jgi:hypothetical protein
MNIDSHEERNEVMEKEKKRKEKKGKEKGKR